MKTGQLIFEPESRRNHSLKKLEMKYEGKVHLSHEDLEVDLHAQTGPIAAPQKCTDRLQNKKVTIVPTALQQKYFSKFTVPSQMETRAGAYPELRHFF